MFTRCEKRLKLPALITFKSLDDKLHRQLEELPLSFPNKAMLSSGSVYLFSVVFQLGIFILCRVSAHFMPSMHIGNTADEQGSTEEVFEQQDETKCLLLGPHKQPTPCLCTDNSTLLRHCRELSHLDVLNVVCSYSHGQIMLMLCLSFKEFAYKLNAYKEILVSVTDENTIDKCVLLQEYLHSTSKICPSRYLAIQK